MADFSAPTMHSSPSLSLLHHMVAWIVSLYFPARPLLSEQSSGTMVAKEGAVGHQEVSAEPVFSDKFAFTEIFAFGEPESEKTRSSSLSPDPTITSEKTPINDAEENPIKDTEQTRPPSPEGNYIRIPDLFSSIMSTNVLINPQYAKVKREANARIARMMMKDERWAAKNAKVDLAFLAAAWCHTCDEATLNLSMDWNHWVFLFDDQFDEGHLMTDVMAAKDEVKQTLAVMDGSLRPSPTEWPIRYVMQTISDGVRKNSPPEFQKHWMYMHQLYYDGLIQQVQDTRDGRLCSYTVQEYLDLRVLTIGVYPAIALTEFSEGLTSIPEHILQHPSLKECMRVSAELVVLVNDIASFKKDLALDMDLNIINLAKNGRQGLSTQQAMDAVGLMIGNCYQRWYRALANMPVWGEKIDREVLRFVGVCRDVALGNLHWSFRTGRYLGGPQGVEVRETRKLRIHNLQKESALAAVDRECLEIAAIYT